MRKLLFFLSLVFTVSCFAQNSSTQGTDFWFSFMTNNSTPTETALIISAEHACTGTVTNPNTNWSTSFSVPANGRIDVVIPLAQAYMTSFGTVANLGCHIVATDTISVFSMNYRDATFDGANILPTDALTNEYVVQTYQTNLNGSSMMVVCTEPNTIVNITPSAATSSGHAAHSTFSITLQPGQCYQLQTQSAYDDFSGSTIIADDCKKIAVYAGNKCANVPAGCSYCDHIYEQMVPIAYWGTKFVVTSSYGRTKDQVRVTALNNNTTVRIDGTLVTTLAAGATYEFMLTSSQAASYIETSGPATTFLYLVGQSCGGTDGDPSMVIITPIEQRVNKITFGTYEYGGTTTNHYVNVVTPTTNVGSVTLDGANISSNFIALPSNPAYSYARMNITHNTHTLESDSGFIAHVYGLYDVTSYAYSVGSSTMDLNTQMFVNDVNTVDIPLNQLYCMNHPIDFYLQLNYAYDNMIWFFGDGDSLAGCPVEHTYTSPGSYPLMVVVEREGSNCYGTSYDTLYRTINVPPMDPIPIYETICEGESYDFYGTEISEAGIYLDTLFSGSDCDSVMELHLTVAPLYDIQLEGEVCTGNVYNQDGFVISTDTTEVGEHVYVHHELSVNGCDSIVTLTLTVLPVQHEVIKDTICQGTGYNQYGFVVSEAESNIVGDFVYTQNLTNAFGCDSISELDLNIISLPTVDFVPQPERIFLSEATDIQFVNLTDISQMPVNDPFVWNWDFGDGNTESTTEYMISHTYGSWGEFIVTLSLEYMGCSSTMEHTVYVEDDLVFPNVLTPNGDNINDVFAIKNLNPDLHNNLTIYNRWGKKVYERDDYRTYEKDGVIYNAEQGFNAAGLSDGVFYFTFHYEGFTRAVEYHGSLTIISE